jgi:hypothetical protein
VTMPVIRTQREARTHDPRKHALIETPRSWAAPILALIRLSDSLHNRGVIVTNIGPGSQGARAAMVRGDILLHYAGAPIHRPTTLKHLVRQRSHGELAHLPVMILGGRRGKAVRFHVVGGHLGITVSPVLRRFGTLGAHREPAVLDNLIEAHEGRALIKTPGDLVRSVFGLVATLEGTSSDRQKRFERSLLKTGHALG